MKLFISYSTKDREFRNSAISSISLVLRREGIRHEFWVDDKEIHSGASIEGEISRGVEWSDIMVKLASESYLDSRWCSSEFEAMRAEQLNGEERTLIPFLFDGADRRRLSTPMKGISTPEIEDRDPSRLLKIGQAIKKICQKWARGN